MDYGKVYHRFWKSRTVRAWDDATRTLALYLLTSQHSTSHTWRRRDHVVSRTKARKLAPHKLLNLIGPHRGPCGLCGHLDARHREADAIVGRVLAGEPVWSVASDFGLPVASVHMLRMRWAVAL